jgi:hypothetical protein
MCHIICKWQDKEQEVSCGVCLWLYRLTINKMLLLLLFSSSLDRSFWSFSSDYKSNDDDNIRIMMMMKQKKKIFLFFFPFPFLFSGKEFWFIEKKKYKIKLTYSFYYFENSIEINYGTLEMAWMFTSMR